VIACNTAAEALADGAVERLDDVLSDGTLRPGGVHALKGSGRPARAFVLDRAGETRDVLLVPLDAAEISGLAPDHFLEELPVALARLRTDGELTYANRAARQLLGETAVPGADVKDLIEGLARPLSERLQDTVRGRGLGRSEVARSKVEGHEIFLQVAFTRTIHDGAESLLAVLSDATELKTLEAQFVQSQKMQAVGQLAGGVAHDFNNLLTAINGHCDLLLMRHDVADIEHGDLMQIRQNANRAAALVRQLLAFSRKQTLRPTVINLQDTLSELAHLLNRLLSEKVALRIENGPDLAPVRVDERQLEQVIMNLVVNARDAMPRGGEVRITTRNIHLGEDLHRDRAVVFKGDYVIIEVADSGTGIPRDKLNKIFEPFFTTKQVGEGTGLGLSTAYGIIKQTGGFIFADSPPGQGATFTIYLPAYETKPDSVSAPIVVEARPPRDLTGRGLVLLVEDEDPVRSFAARALQLRGYTVVEATSGEEALEILSDDGLHVDILLSDVIMPGLDGPAWVREARKSRPDAKVIFMSGYTEDVFSGGDCGIPGAAFLPKPFTLPELTQRVKDTLDA
jgi:two-component system cell cycle sensor histidine kinase/response regulator CckA